MHNPDASIDLSPGALAGAIESNQHALWQYLARWPGMELQHEPDLSWFITGIALPSMNGVYGARLAGAGLEARVAAALAPFRARALPMKWWVGPSTQPPELGSTLEAHGLHHEGDSPGMAVDLHAVHEEVAPAAGVRVELVRDPAGLAASLAVILGGEAGLQTPLGQGLLAMETSLGFEPGSPYRRYVAILDGQPSAVATLFLGAGAAGIYNVFTRPEARGRGLGSRLTLAPLLAAREAGYRIGVLVSSPMGLSLYRRLGFREYCRIGHYAAYWEH